MKHCAWLISFLVPLLLAAAPRHRELRMPVAGATVGAVVRDIATGEYLVSQNADRAMTPASVAKCLTAAAVVQNGTLDQRFQTPAYLSGTINVGGIATGDIVVEGSADPSLQSSLFPEYLGFADSIAMHLQQLGVKQIYGEIKVLPGHFPDAGANPLWEDEDFPWYYGTGLYGFNYRENARGDRALNHPEQAFVADLRRALTANGIKIEASAVEPRNSEQIPLYTHFSPTYREILAQMVMHSDNLLAEGMLRTLAPEQSRQAALEAERALIGQLGTNTWKMQLYDGSGLTRGNRLSPRQLSSLLEEMAFHPQGSDYLNLFPLVGQEGTVKHLLNDTPLEGSLILKSGSMKGVLCYAGYKLDANGHPTHTVVLMVNGFSRQRPIKERLASFLQDLFQPENSLNFLSSSAEPSAENSNDK